MPKVPVSKRVFALFIQKSLEERQQLDFDGYKSQCESLIVDHYAAQMDFEANDQQKPNMIKLLKALFPNLHSQFNKDHGLSNSQKVGSFQQSELINLAESILFRIPKRRTQLLSESKTYELLSKQVKDVFFDRLTLLCSEFHKQFPEFEYKLFVQTDPASSLQELALPGITDDQVTQYLKGGSLEDLLTSINDGICSTFQWPYTINSNQFSPDHPSPLHLNIRHESSTSSSISLLSKDTKDTQLLVLPNRHKSSSTCVIYGPFVSPHCNYFKSKIYLTRFAGSEVDLHQMGFKLDAFASLRYPIFKHSTVWLPQESFDPVDLEGEDATPDHLEIHGYYLEMPDSEILCSLSARIYQAKMLARGLDWPDVYECDDAIEDPENPEFRFERLSNLPSPSVNEFDNDLMDLISLIKMELLGHKCYEKLIDEELTDLFEIHKQIKNKQQQRRVDKTLRRLLKQQQDLWLTQQKKTYRMSSYEIIDVVAESSLLESKQPMDDVFIVVPGSQDPELNLPHVKFLSDDPPLLFRVPHGIHKDLKIRLLVLATKEVLDQLRSCFDGRCVRKTFDVVGSLIFRRPVWLTHSQTNRQLAFIDTTDYFLATQWKMFVKEYRRNAAEVNYGSSDDSDSSSESEGQY